MMPPQETLGDEPLMEADSSNQLEGSDANNAAGDACGEADCNISAKQNVENSHDAPNVPSSAELREIQNEEIAGTPAVADIESGDNYRSTGDNEVRVSEPAAKSNALMSEYTHNKSSDVDQYNGAAKGEYSDIDGYDGVDDDFVAIELATPKISGGKRIPQQTTTDQSTQPTCVASTSTNNSNQQLAPPPRRRIFRHPILTPLTKLPWDKIVTAAGSCDLLFNCKYSMRQVEDEVREEYRKDGDLVQEQVGRDGYVNLSLGNECGDYQYGDEEARDADEYPKIGLACGSMLDDEEEDEDDEEGEAVDQEGLLQQGVLLPQQPMSNCEVEDDHKEQVNSVEKVGEGQVQSPIPPAPNPSLILSDEQKAEDSWKRSNPSLDMMLYRTMINE